MTDPEPVPEEAVETVFGWCHAVLEGDVDRMWINMDDNLRLYEAQLWVFANLDDPAFAGADRDELA